MRGSTDRPSLGRALTWLRELPPRIAFFWQKTPGIRLGGQPEEPPADFASIDADPVSWVETRGKLPYVVAVGYLARGRAVYMVAKPLSTWLARVRGNPEVRLRIGDSVFLMRASVLDKSEELERFLVDYNVKYKDWIAEYYGYALTPDNVHEILVPLRLEPRA